MARTRSALGGMFVFSFALWSLLVAATAAAAGPADEVAARLAAGEFGPALAAAGAVNDAGLRDKLFGQIAAAQAGAGAKFGALDTAVEISSDLARKEALGSMAAGGQGGAKPVGARGGMSGADITEIIRRALEVKVRQVAEGGAANDVTTDDLLDAIDRYERVRSVV